jgi:hypothetical protein
MVSASIICAIVLIIVFACAVAAWSIARRNRSRSLREHFGPEYDEALRHYGSRRAAEAALARRRTRMEGAPIRHFRPEEQEIMAGRWHDIQARFVDNPQRAIQDADALVTEAMRTRGYPVEGFPAQADDLSVNYPRVVHNYRAAHEIAMRQGRSAARLEDLRRALIYYRAVVEELSELKSVH